MNFIQICQEANRLAGMQGTISTVATATGYEYTLVRFVAQAWIDLQNLRKDWPFMKSDVTFNATVGKTEYSLSDIGATDVARWHLITYTDSDSDQQPLQEFSYDRYILDNKVNDSQGSPAIYAVDPVDKHLYLNPPDTTYSMTCYYFTEPVELTTASQEPSLADSFHMVLAYLGAAHMAAYMGNGNLYSELRFRADQMIGSLMRSENPAKRVFIRGIA